MAFDRDYDADAKAFENYEPPPSFEYDDDDEVEHITCPKHGPTLVLSYNADLNLLHLRCGCDI